MARDVVAAPAGRAGDRCLQGGVLEWLDLAAVVADEVVMVLGAAHGLEARDAVAEVDPLDEPAAVEALEGAVHARDPDARASRADGVVDLESGQAAVLPVEELDDLAPCGPAPPALGAEALERLFRPGECGPASSR